MRNSRDCSRRMTALAIRPPFSGGRCHCRNSELGAWRSSSVAGFERDLRFVIEPQVAVVDLERQGRQGRAIDPAPFGSVEAAVGLPAPRLVARCRLEGDDLVANLGIPPGPRFAAVLVKGEGRVIPVVDVGLAAVGVVAGARTRPPRSWRDRARRRPGTGGRPRPRRSSLE